jgi:DNA-3-methyladenine glycosylase
MGGVDAPNGYCRMKREVVSTARSELLKESTGIEAITARPVLSRSFYERDAVEVARGLLGQFLVLGRCAGRIAEVEAYLGVEDRAAHASRGRTERTSVLYGPPGHVYVYLIYGMYECLNLVAEPEGSPGCVLIRALEPVAGIAAMRRRRPRVKNIYELCSGPGRLTRAMGISRALYGTDATSGPLTVREGEPVKAAEAGCGPRIGIKHCVDWPLRFWIPGNRSVSRTR